jgi:hypothetical protein
VYPEHRVREVEGDPVQLSSLVFDAVSKMRKSDRSGEPGEILLYLMLEIVLDAPQLVSKVSLKTSSEMEVHGADALHVAWEPEAAQPILYFGEAKLHKERSSAIRSAFKSIERFESNDDYDDEILLANSHIQFASKRLKTFVTKMLNPLAGTPDYISRHACLIGYDKASFGQSDEEKRTSDLLVEYLAEERLSVEQLLKQHVGRTTAEFEFDFFILPLPSVQCIRDRFQQLLFGTK